MRAVGVEEAAPVGAEQLDRFLACDGAERDRLPRPLERRRIDRTAERLRHAVCDQEERINDADRQQEIERHAGHIGPEIAQRVRLAARSEEHTSELQSLMRISYAVFGLKKNK